MHLRKRLLRVLPLLGIAAIISCNPFDRIAAELDKVAVSIEEYGTISVSSPLLFRVRATTQRFKFGLNRDAEDYFKDAKHDVHGASASSLQQSEDTQFGLSVRFNYNDYLRNRMLLDAYDEALDAFRLKQNLQFVGSVSSLIGTLTSQPTSLPSTNPADWTGEAALNFVMEEQSRQLTALGSGLKELASSIGPTSRPTPPTLEQSPPPLESPLPSTRPAQGELTTQRFEPFQGLLNNVTTSQPSRAAIITAAGDHMTQQLLDFISDPREAAEFGGKRLYFGVMMVTCQPGDRTYRGYRADVSVRVSLGKVEKSVASEKPPRMQPAEGLGQPHIPSESSGSNAVDPAGKSEEGNVEKSVASEEPPRMQPAGGLGQPHIPSESSGSNAVDPAGKSEEGNPEGGAESSGTTWKDSPFIEIMGVSPLVASVSPLTDAQALDLKASARLQQAYALRLAAALSGMGANVQADFFRDWVRRLERDVSTRTNLNAVTAYSISGGVFGYQVTPRLQALANPAAEEAKPDLILQPIAFPVLVVIGIDEWDIETFGINAIGFHQTTRWLRAGYPTADKELFGRFFSRAGNPRMTEKVMMDRVKHLREARNVLTDEVVKKNPTLARYADERIEMYGFAAGTHSFSFQMLERDPRVEPDTSGAASEIAKLLTNDVAFRTAFQTKLKQFNVQFVSASVKGGTLTIKTSPKVQASQQSTAAGKLCDIATKRNITNSDLVIPSWTD